MSISFTKLQHTGGFLGTVVMKVIATDADKENTNYSMISYSIDEQASTAGLFRINSHTGEVTVQRNTLDREASHSTNLKFFFCHLVQNTLDSHTVYNSRQLVPPRIGYNHCTTFICHVMLSCCSFCHSHLEK